MINFAIIIIFLRNSAIVPETKLYYSQIGITHLSKQKKDQDKISRSRFECCLTYITSQREGRIVSSHHST